MYRCPGPPGGVLWSFYVWEIFWDFDNRPKLSHFRSGVNWFTGPAKGRRWPAWSPEEGVADWIIINGRESISLSLLVIAQFLFMPAFWVFCIFSVSFFWFLFFASSSLLPKFHFLLSHPRWTCGFFVTPFTWVTTDCNIVRTPASLLDNGPALFRVSSSSMDRRNN